MYDQISAFSPMILLLYKYDCMGTIADPTCEPNPTRTPFTNSGCPFILVLRRVNITDPISERHMFRLGLCMTRPQPDLKLA